jgi:hypothetical protein
MMDFHYDEKIKPDIEASGLGDNFTSSHCKLCFRIQIKNLYILMTVVDSTRLVNFNFFK